MKKVLLTCLVLFMSISVSLSQADAAAVTSKKSDNSAKSVNITGNGGYVKFSCTYSGSTSNMGSDGYCELIKKSNANVTSLNVGGTTSKTKSVDYYLDKGASYILQVDVEVNAPSNGSVTGSTN